MAKFDPFLSLDCARVEGVGAQSKERKGSNFAAQLSGAIVQKPEGPNTYNSKNPAIANWQPWHQDCVVVDEHLSAGKLAPIVRNLVLSVHVKDVGDGVVEHEVVSGNVVLTWSVT